MGKVSKAMNKVEPGSEHDKPSPASPQTTKQMPPATAEPTHSPEKRPLTVSADPPPASPGMEKWDQRLVEASENFSGIAESFRKLRTMILHPESGSPARTIMVLSSDPQEGKSFVTANLGISFSQSVEHQALMIDCDLRRPSLQNLFGLKYKHGLSNYLRNEGYISDMIYSTGLPKLSIIPAGSPPKNPSELLSSEKMADMLNELKEEHPDQLLVIDTPPFHAASETLVLSQLVDKVVLVVRWGKSGRENIKKMTDLIGREKIIGTVFNAFEMNILDRKVQGMGYHNYYSESYY